MGKILKATNQFATKRSVPPKFTISGIKSLLITTSFSNCQNNGGRYQNDIKFSAQINPVTHGRKNNLPSIHYRYVILILLSISVFLMTDRWTERGDFTQYLSNAATMTSLLLGVVPIFHSFISNSNMSNSLGSVSEVSKDVGKVGEKIAEHHQNSGELIVAGAKSAQAFEEVSREITGNLQNFHVLLKDMDSKNIAMRALMEGIPSKFSQLEARFNQVADSVEKQEQVAAPPGQANQWNLTMFVSRSGDAENFITYACILHAEQDKILDVQKVCEILEFGNAAVLNSFIRCLDSADLITLITSETGNMTYHVSTDTDVKAGDYAELIVEDIKKHHTNKKAEELFKSLDNLKDYAFQRN